MIITLGCSGCVGSKYMKFLSYGGVGHRASLAGGTPMDHSKIGRELGWGPAESFKTGIRRTIDWCLKSGWFD